MPLSPTGARARRVDWRGWKIENWFLNAVNLFKSCTTDAAAQVLTLGRCARAAALLVLLLLPTRGIAISGTVTHIDLPAATAAELAEAPIPIGRLVQSSADPKVVYIGDGYTFGGISLWNFAALTNPPPDYDRDLEMHNYHVRLDGSYSLNAEAGRLTAWYGTNAIWQIIAAASAADDTLLSVVPDGTNMAFTVAATNDDLTVETCSSLADAVWTSVDYGIERLTPLTVKITVPAPAAGVMQYVRVLTAGGTVGMVVTIPLSVPSLKVGGADVTATTVSNWNAAFGWGDHGVAGYLTEETDQAALGALDDYLTTDAAALLYQPTGNYATGTPVYAETVSNGSTERIALGSPVSGDGPEYGEILFGYRENNTMAALRFIDGDVLFGPTGTSWTAWSLDGGTNSWAGRINDGEAARIRSIAASGLVITSANATNVFLRPDGGTNTIVVDTNANMQVWAGTNLALTIRADGNIGVRGAGASYPLHVSGNGYCTENFYAKKLIDSQNGAYAVDPNGASTLTSLSLSSTLTVTQGVSQIILPTSTNGLVPGTLWNNGGTVSVMP